MNYRIEEKEPFRIIGITKRVSIVFNGVNEEIASMWKSLNPDSIQTLKSFQTLNLLELLVPLLIFLKGEWRKKENLITILE